MSLADSGALRVPLEAARRTAYSEQFENGWATIAWER